MEVFNNIKNNIYAFTEKHKLTEISSLGNQSNLQIIFKNNEIKLEFLRDKGEFDIYIEFIEINTKKKIYSVVLLAKILSEMDYSNSEAKGVIDYLDKNIENIKKSFVHNLQIEEEYDIAFKNSFW